MKVMLCLFIAMIAAFTAEAANPIPDELVGVWADKSAGALLMLRGDGLTMLAGTVGAPMLATFEPKDATLTLTVRNEAGETAGQCVLRYDAQIHRLTGLKWTNYFDPAHPKVKLPKPHEDAYPYHFEQLSKELDEQFRSLDLKKALKLR